MCELSKSTTYVCSDITDHKRLGWPMITITRSNESLKIIELRWVVQFNLHRFSVLISQAVIDSFMTIWVEALETFDF